MIKLSILLLSLADSTLRVVLLVTYVSFSDFGNRLLGCYGLLISLVTLRGNRKMSFVRLCKFGLIRIERDD